MITITSSSLNVSIDLLLSIDFNHHSVFYHDYHSTYQVVELIVHTTMRDEEDSREYHYELVLVGTSNLKFNVIDDKVRLAPSN